MSTPFRLHLQASAACSAIALAALAGCGGNDDNGSDNGSGQPSNAGTMSVALTDAPACGLQQANLTIQSIRLNATANAGPSDAGWTDLAVTSPSSVDLLGLSNGQMQTIGTFSVPAGQYSSVEFVLATNGSSAPYANSVTASAAGSTESSLSNWGDTSTSTAAGGYVVPADITITSGQTSNEVLSIDACQSFAQNAMTGQWYFNPVATLMPFTTTAVTGNVDASLANGDTRITLQQGGRIVGKTSPDANGAFTITSVPAGTYDLVFTAPGRDTAVITGVQLTANQTTTLPTASAPITLATAATGTAMGVVTSSSNPTQVGAQVSYTQTLTNGDVVNVGSTVVDVGTGAYTTSLAAAAPMVAAWNGSNTLTFTPDLMAGVMLTPSATSAGATQAGTSFSVTSGGTTTSNFGF